METHFFPALTLLKISLVDGTEVKCLLALELDEKEKSSR
jgi:hypothetical protein